MKKKKLKKKIIRLKALNKDLKDLVCGLETQIQFLTDDYFIYDSILFYLMQFSDNPDVTVQELIDSLNEQLCKE